MPLDERGRETQHWLGIAKSDLGAGRNLSARKEFSSQAAFFAQQAAEKAIKGYLVWQQVRFKKDHDIRYLGNLALKKDAVLKAAIDEAVALNPFAVTFRYPGEEDLPSSEDAIEALAIAEKLLNEILEKLPAEVHP